MKLINLWLQKDNDFENKHLNNYVLDKRSLGSYELR